MKVAISYKDNMIFEHFGKSESFKIYTIENGEILNSEVIDTNGTGHEALALFLKDLGVDVVICGGIGDGAISALNNAGIEIISGISGEADEAARKLALDNLESQGGHCDHHDHEDEEGCGSCGGGCGSCGGCHTPTLEGKNAGKTVKVHYRGTFNDGTQFDSSYDRNEPLEFVCGTGMMIPGFDKAVVNMEVNEEVDIHLMPEEAYGPSNPEAIFSAPINQLPGIEKFEVGTRIMLRNMYGQRFPALIIAKDEENVTFDANHEMAGKELNFHIKLLEVE